MKTVGHFIAHDAVAEFLRTHLHCVGGLEAIVGAAASERVRNALAVECPPGVKTLSLTGRVRELVRGVFPDYLERRKYIRRGWGDYSCSSAMNRGGMYLLSALCDIGDIQRYGDAHFALDWRVIGCSETDEYVVVIGSMPHSLLEMQVGSNILTSGVTRFAKAADLSHEVMRDLTRQQSIAAWLGVEEYALVRWAERIIAKPPAQKENGVPLDASVADKIEMYLPEQSRRRWIDLQAAKTAPFGAQLCRWLDPKTRRIRYFLANLEMSNATCRVKSSYVLVHNTGVRLMYGIDGQRKTPFEFRGTIRGSEFEVSVSRDLPEPESRLFRYFGTQLVALRTVSFPVELRAFVECALTYLGCTLSLVAETATK